ncbi:MAG: hypothetical protein WD063_03870 [Pirellulales bacterium]
MNDGELRNLLRGADADFEKPIIAPGELAGRVRRLDQKRRRRSRVLLTAVPVVVVAAVATAWSLVPRAALPTGTEKSVAGAALDWGEIERLQAEADFHERLARQMIALRKRDRALEQAQRALAEPDPLDVVREQVDVVAYRMIQRADELRTQMDPSEEAIRLYRDVEQLFPKTHSAEVARERLTALAAREGET